MLLHLGSLPVRWMLHSYYSRSQRPNQPLSSGLRLNVSVLGHPPGNETKNMWKWLRKEKEFSIFSVFTENSECAMLLLFLQNIRSINFTKRASLFSILQQQQTKDLVFLEKDEVRSCQHLTFSVLPTFLLFWPKNYSLTFFLRN